MNLKLRYPEMLPTDPCPCGSSLSYAACCGRYHRGAPAPSAEALMRSRYTAYRLGLADYLRDSWHATTRPLTLSLGRDEPQWCGLEIRSSSRGGDRDDHGEVEFVARWLAPDGRSGTLHERSRFVREQGRWFYVDGTVLPGAVQKVGRNEPCPCGSGRKFKQCCGR